MLFSTILPRWPMNVSSYFFRLDRSKISSRYIKLSITRKKSIDFISKLARKISKCCLSSAHSPCMGSIQFEYEQQSGERKRICIYPARSHLEDLVLDKGRPAPYSKAKSSKVDHLTDRSGSVEFSLPPSLTFSFFLAPVSTSVGSSS